MIEYIGWLSGMLFAFCGVPQAYKSWREKSSEGLSWAFLLMWGFGEIFLLIYSISKGLPPVIFNAGFSTIIVAIIVRYKFK